MTKKKLKSFFKKYKIKVQRIITFGLLTWYLIFAQSGKSNVKAKALDNGFQNDGNEDDGSPVEFDPRQFKGGENPFEDFNYLDPVYV